MVPPAEWQVVKLTLPLGQQDPAFLLSKIDGFLRTLSPFVTHRLWWHIHTNAPVGFGQSPKSCQEVAVVHLCSRLRPFSMVFDYLAGPEC